MEPSPSIPPPPTSVQTERPRSSATPSQLPRPHQGRPALVGKGSGPQRAPSWTRVHAMLSGASGRQPGCERRQKQVARPRARRARVAVLAICVAAASLAVSVEDAGPVGESLGAIGLGADVAAAASSAGQDFKSDGCSWVTDKVWGVFDFYESCVGHDKCYQGHPHGDGWSGRWQCDADFYWDMVATCSGWTGWICTGVASLYWFGVRAYGAGAFDEKLMTVTWKAILTTPLVFGIGLPAWVLDSIL